MSRTKITILGKLWFSEDGGLFTDRITRWSAANNPFFEGPSSDLLSMMPFVVLTGLLYLVAREVMLAPRRSRF